MITLHPRAQVAAMVLQGFLSNQRAFDAILESALGNREDANNKLVGAAVDLTDRLFEELRNRKDEA